MIKYITYLRVSTEGQGRSGLGLEAQRTYIKGFLAIHGGEEIAEYVEVESGSKDARPLLLAAQAHAKRERCAVVVAKLDRLSRDAYYILGLMKHKVRFVVAELGPDVDPFMLHIYAAMAEKERAMISARTKAALQAARARGVKLGGFRDAAGPAATAAAVRRNADARAIALELQGAGVTLVAIAAQLQAKGIKAPRGGSSWHPKQVARLL
jgi:DNA invertase Pin-like site-specific DNA recombinase